MNYTLKNSVRLRSVSRLWKEQDKSQHRHRGCSVGPCLCTTYLRLSFFSLQTKILGQTEKVKFVEGLIYTIVCRGTYICEIKTSKVFFENSRLRPGRYHEPSFHFQKWILFECTIGPSPCKFIREVRQ